MTDPNPVNSLPKGRKSLVGRKPGVPNKIYAGIEKRLY
jgi:hypothetical protein